MRKTYGPIAVPEKVFYVRDLPKTRSGKIMRRMLRNVLLGIDVGDTSTLINPESILLCVLSGTICSQKKKKKDTGCIDFRFDTIDLYNPL